jgi:polyferredoxin
VRDLTAVGPIGRLLRIRAFQFVAILPAAAGVAVVLVSTSVGIQHPSFNFGTVFTWVVWWGGLLLSFVIAGRAWCLVCPVGAVSDWIQRLGFWGRSRFIVGYGLRWPGRLRSMWPATGLLLVFVWLDNGYGVSNSPRLTAALVAVLILAAAWTGLLFERRTFCRYLCPLTSFIGLNALFSVLELRARDPGTCRTGCRPGLLHAVPTAYGCPMGEFGAPVDTNLHCSLHGCLRACPHGNVVLRLRPPGRDLWEMRRTRPDGSYAAAIVVGLASILPLLTLLLLPAARGIFAGILPAGDPPNDPPRLVAVAVLFAAWAALSVGLVYGFSALSRWTAGAEGMPTGALFARYAYALIPVGLFRFLADLFDHAARTWGALADVTRALLLDFPWNQVVPGRVTAVHLLGPVETYAVQVGLLLGRLLFTLYAMHRVSLRLFADREAALASFLPMAGLAALLTLGSLWTLGLPLL